MKINRKRIPTEKQIKDFMDIFEKEISIIFKKKFEQIINATERPKIKTGDEPSYLEVLSERKDIVKNEIITDYQLSLVREKAKFLALIPEDRQRTTSHKLIMAFNEYNSEYKKMYGDKSDKVNQKKKRLLKKANSFRNMLIKPDPLTDTYPYNQFIKLFDLYIDDLKKGSSLAEMQMTHSIMPLNQFQDGHTKSKKTIEFCINTALKNYNITGYSKEVKNFIDLIRDY
jgi:hypothetical protein